VAIRTVAVDKTGGKAEYGVGGGIVWDSDAGEEYEECRTKAAVLTAEPPDFDLLETMLWEPRNSFFLMEEHLKRVRRSALYFGFRFDAGEVSRTLSKTALDLAGTEPARSCRVRLLLARSGTLRVEYSVIAQPPGRRWRVGVASEPVDTNDPLLYHKTTHRVVYERARKGAAGVDDVLLWNADGEITESTIANVVVESGGRRLTPPVRCGLLPGVFRGWLLDRGEIEEAVITLDDLRRADKVYLINCVRRWMPAELV